MTDDLATPTQEVQRFVEDLKRYGQYNRGETDPPYGKDLFMTLSSAAHNGASEEDLEEIASTYEGPALDLVLHDVSVLIYLRAASFAIAEL